MDKPLENETSTQDALDPISTLHKELNMNQPVSLPSRTDSARIAPETNAASAMVLPFRKSIWRQTTRYQFENCSRQQFKAISQLYDVIASKYRIEFPDLTDTLALADAINAMPDDPAPETDRSLVGSIVDYLQYATRLRGVQIPTAICALAVLKEGRYAPMDGKVARGLVTLNIVTDEVGEALVGRNVAAFARVYTAMVLPAWHRALLERSHEQADAYWASQS